jgi:hypothetical protein
MLALYPFTSADGGADLETLITEKKIKRDGWLSINAKCSWYNLCRDARDFGWLTYNEATTTFSVTDEGSEALVAYQEGAQLDEEVESVLDKVSCALLDFLLILVGTRLCSRIGKVSLSDR